MKLKAKISWLMGTVQQSLFPYLDESLPDPLTEPERPLVKILKLVQIEQHVPVRRRRQWLGRSGHGVPRCSGQRASRDGIDRLHQPGFDISGGAGEAGQKGQVAQSAEEAGESDLW